MATGRRSEPLCRHPPLRRPPKERFLSADEFALLGRLLCRAEEKFPRQTAIVRLIALTGARKSEIMTLEWDWYRDDGSGAGGGGGRHLHLPDSKTGAKTIWLCTAARGIIEAQPRSDARCHRWIFPAARRAGPVPCINSFWKTLKAGTAIADVRLHDLRHSYASIALREGCTIRVIGRLLGHADPATTLKYTHLEDAQIRAAADAVSAGLAGGGEGGWHAPPRDFTEGFVRKVAGEGCGPSGSRPKDKTKDRPKDRLIMDAGCPGLGLRLRAGGGRRYVCLVGGRYRTIGDPALMPLEDARAACRRMRAEPDDAKPDCPSFAGFVKGLAGAVSGAAEAAIPHPLRGGVAHPADAGLRGAAAGCDQPCRLSCLVRPLQRHRPRRGEPHARCAAPDHGRGGAGRAYRAQPDEGHREEQAHPADALSDAGGGGAPASHAGPDGGGAPRLRARGSISCGCCC